MRKGGCSPASLCVAVSESEQGLTSTPAPSSPTAVEPSARSLMDVPLSWLAQLSSAASLGDNDELALMRTCTFMRDQVLRQRAVRINFQLPLTSVEALAAQGKLLLASKYSSHVHLRLQGWGMARLGKDRSLGTASAQALLSGAVATAGHALDAVRAAHLEYIELDSLVPSWLGSACPQLEALALIDCRFDESTTKLLDAIPGSAQLQHLELWCHGQGPAWQQQMNSLTGLTSLTLHVQSLHILKGCPTWLTDLNLLGAKVTDGILEVLLSMPQLARVTCRGFQLIQSYSPPCSWTHLEVEVLDVEQFNRLPLDDLTSIRIQAPAQATIIPSCDLVECTRVAAAVVKCGGIKTNSSGVLLGKSSHNISDADGGSTDSACLIALLPILARIRIDQLVLSNCTITPELLLAMSQHLDSCGLRSLSIAHDCDWAPDVWPLLLPSLPSTVSRIHIGGTAVQEAIKEANIVAMCVTAPRPVTVTIVLQDCRSWLWDSGLEEQVAAAMAAAGHQHVTLNVTGSLHGTCL